jgi:hypothetical protein
MRRMFRPYRSQMAAAWYFWEAMQYPLETAANMSGGSFHKWPPMGADMGGVAR